MARNFAAATISGGSVGGTVNVLQKGSAILSGVAVRTAAAIGNSKLEIRTGTAVAENVIANENGTVVMFGGLIAQFERTVRIPLSTWWTGR